VTGPGHASVRRHAAVLAVILAGTALVLARQGRVWWCQAGGLSPWSWDIWSLHNSQHLLDPYTFSHVQHGLLFYGLGLLLLRRYGPALRFGAALALEALWEIAENTDQMIERYRTVTISLDYFGDSILNSLADIVACAAGYGIAAALPAWGSVALFAVIEATMLLCIRDSLLLNIWMLVSPSQRLMRWQMGGQPPV
jgi:hypothetical protein